MDIVQSLARWFHILMGVLWIGLLYFFNFINSSYTAALDAESKKTMFLELMPRAQFWFRWAAAWTWITGVLLLMLVFYHGGIIFEGVATRWGAAAIIMVVLTFAVTFFYDLLAKSPLGRNMKLFGSVGFVLTTAIILLYVYWGGFSYRAFNIHVGAMFGTIMAFNVWFRIRPAQQKIMAAVRDGQPPDPALLTLVATRARHSTYLTVPLFWTMMNQHTVSLAGGAYGIPDGLSWLVLLIIIALGWHIVFQLFKRAGKLTGLSPIEGHTTE